MRTEVAPRSTLVLDVYYTGHAPTVIAFSRLPSPWTVEWVGISDWHWLPRMSLNLINTNTLMLNVERTAFCFRLFVLWRSGKAFSLGRRKPFYAKAHQILIKTQMSHRNAGLHSECRSPVTLGDLGGRYALYQFPQIKIQNQH